jgi:myo-inositol-1(or 4)-monophosphatase
MKDKKIKEVVMICDKIVDQIKALLSGKDIEWNTLEEINKIEEEIHKAADEIAFEVLENSGIGFLVLTKSKPDLRIKKRELGNGIDFALVIDTIDGSKNFVRGFPFYSFSFTILNPINLRLDEIIFSKVVNLYTGDAFYAFKGEGAFYNGRKIKVRGVRDLREATIGIDMNLEKKPYNKKLINLIPRLLECISTKGDVRRLGTNAFEQCLVANGALDMFIDLRGTQSILEILPSKLIVEEAGGIVTDGDGQLLKGNIFERENTTAIFSSNIDLVNQLLELINNI